MEIFILLALIVIVGGAYYWFNLRQSDEKVIDSPPQKSSYNQKSEFADLMKPTKPKSSPKLTERKKIEGEITSDAVTLIAESSSGRDEFFGWIDIIDGHHTEPSANRDYEKVQSWEYLGFGDRFDSNQRGKDFDQLRKQFWQKVDGISANMASENWTSEVSSDSGGKQIIFLTRQAGE